jgi:hypothetical protein
MLPRAGRFVQIRGSPGAVNRQLASSPPSRYPCNASRYAFQTKAVEGPQKE